MAKNILAPLRITAAASQIDVGVQKKNRKKRHGSGTTTPLISNEEMNNIIKIVHTLEDSHILLEGITKTSENVSKEQKKNFYECY